MFYEMELNEYFENRYVIYDESRCTPPAPEPEPAPIPMTLAQEHQAASQAAEALTLAANGRRRAQGMVSVWCSKDEGGEYQCRERERDRRRRLADGVAAEAEAEAEPVVDNTPAQMQLNFPNMTLPTDFETTLLAELNALAGLFLQEWFLQECPDAPPQVDEETGVTTQYAYVTVYEAKANVLELCEFAKGLGLQYSSTAVGSPGAAGIYSSGDASAVCNFRDDLCVPVDGESPCQTNACKLRGAVNRFSIDSISHPEAADSERRRMVEGPMLAVVVRVEPSSDPDAASASDIVADLVSQITAGSLGAQYSFLGLPDLIPQVLVYVPEPEPEPAPEPDPDGIVTRTTVVLDAGTAPANWNQTIGMIAGALEIRPECADGLTIGCMESWQFGVTHVTFVILEGDKDMEKVQPDWVRVTISTLFPALCCNGNARPYNVSGIGQNTIFLDTSGPVIALKGETDMTLYMYSKYVEQGAVAFDNMDGDMTRGLVIRAAVDTEIAGIYNVIYTVSDSTGNEGKMVRVITVADQFGFRRGMPHTPVARANESCDFQREVVEDGYLLSTGRDGRRYSKATRPSKTWEWPYAIPESYYTSNLRANRTYRVRTRAISAAGAGMWSEAYELKTAVGKNVLQGEHIFGCQDPIALNYNSRATYGDGSCVFERPPLENRTGRPLGSTEDELNVTRSAVYGWDGDDGSIFVVGGTRSHKQWGYNDTANLTQGVESGRDDYTDYPTYHNFVAGGNPGEGLEGWQQYAREARQRGDYYTDDDTADHGPWATWGGNPQTSSHTPNVTGPATVQREGENIHTVFDTANTEATTNWGTPNYGDQSGPGPELLVSPGTTTARISGNSGLPDPDCDAGDEDCEPYNRYREPSGEPGYPDGGASWPDFAVRTDAQQGSLYAGLGLGRCTVSEFVVGQSYTIVSGRRFATRFTQKQTLTDTPGETFSVAAADCNPDCNALLVQPRATHTALMTKSACMAMSSTNVWQTQHYMEDTPAQYAMGSDAFAWETRDTLGMRPERNTGGAALSGQQAFDLAAKLRAESIQELLRNTRSDDVYRLVHGEPWGHRPGYGGKLGGGDPDLDLGAATASGTATHPTGVPRRLRDPEYRIHHGMAIRGQKQPWHYNLTAEDIADYKGFDVDIVRLAFQWDTDNPDYNMLGKRYMTFRACVQSLNATALNMSWVDGYENVSTHLDRVVGPKFEKGYVGYGDLADTGLDPDYDPLAPRSERLVDGLIGGHGEGPRAYTDKYGYGPPQGESEEEGDGFGFSFIPDAEDQIIPIAHGLLQPFTACDEVTITIHIRVEGWGEDMFWQVDGGTLYGPYPNTPGHYYEALYLTSGEHNITVLDAHGNGWCNPVHDLEDGDGLLRSQESRCGYWDIGDDTGRVLAGGPIAGLVHSTGSWHTFSVPSRCGAGDEVGENSRPGHRTSSAWNLTEYNSLMWYCEERVYINCSETPQNCTFYINQTNGEWIQPPTGDYANYDTDQPLGPDGTPINFLMDDADLTGMVFEEILAPMKGPDFSNRPYYDRSAEFTGEDLPMYDPQLGGIPWISPEMGAQPNHRIDPLQPTSVLPPGDDPNLRPSSHGVRDGPRPSYNSDHHDGPAFEQRPLIDYPNAGLWPGSRGETSVEIDRTVWDGSTMASTPGYTTGLNYGEDGSYTGAGPANNEVYRWAYEWDGDPTSAESGHPGHDQYSPADPYTGLGSSATHAAGIRQHQTDGSVVGSQIHYGDTELGLQGGGTDRTGKRRLMQTLERLGGGRDQSGRQRRLLTSLHQKVQQRSVIAHGRAQTAAIAAQSKKFEGAVAGTARRLQSGAAAATARAAGLGSRYIDGGYPEVDRWQDGCDDPNACLTVDDLIRRRVYIPDSVFDGQIWPVNTYGYRPKATHYPPNPGLTDADLVGILHNPDSLIIPDALRANVENQGFYEVPETWHGVSVGVASPQTTTNPWWMDEWPSGGRPSQDQPRDMSIEALLLNNRLGGFWGHDQGVNDGKGDYTTGLGTPGGDEFQGGEASNWVGAWPEDGTGYDSEIITGWPAQEYVDPSQNSEYSDRQDARTDVMYTEDLAYTREAGEAIDAWLDQMYVRDMAFEDMMEARRNAERERLADEAEMRALARARRSAEQLARKRGTGLRTHEWDWVDDADVPLDGPQMDPLFCHGLTYEQCNFKVHRQEFLVIPGKPLNMTEYLFANNLTANYSEFAYNGDEHFVVQRTDNFVPYGGLDPVEKVVYVGDTVHISWSTYENVHVAYYYEDTVAECPLDHDVPLCQGVDLCDFEARGLGTREVPRYWDSGDRQGGTGMPAAVMAGSHTQRFFDVSQAGTYCVGSQGLLGNMFMTLRVEVHPCDMSKVGRGSPCDPPSAPPLCNATLDTNNNVKWQTLTGLQQYKLLYIWSHNFTDWDGSYILPEDHYGKFTGYNTYMPIDRIQSFSTEGVFDQPIHRLPGYLYNSTLVNATYVNYTTIGGYINQTTGEFVEEEYINGTWLNETRICEDQVILIPDRQVCWAGYFKRVSNSGIHTGHAKSDSYYCTEPSNVYDTVPPYYFDQLNEWKDEQLMYPPVVWELVETFEARGIKVILDTQKVLLDGKGSEREGLGTHTDSDGKSKGRGRNGQGGTDEGGGGYPLCGYGVETDFQSESDIYACFIPSSDSRNNRNRFSPGDWNRAEWGYDPYPDSHDDKGSNKYPKHQGEINVPHRPPRKRTHPLVNTYGYREGNQQYYPNLDNVDPLYTKGSGLEPQFGGYGNDEQQYIVRGGPHHNPHGTWGAMYDDESYAENRAGSTPIEAKPGDMEDFMTQSSGPTWRPPVRDLVPQFSPSGKPEENQG
jgi:hypothetical protein